MKVKYLSSSTSFTFGSREHVVSSKVVILLSEIAGRQLNMETEIFNCDLPLLLSKDPIKKAEMSTDFSKDTVIIFGKTQKLLFTSSGHYCIPVGKQIELCTKLDLVNNDNNMIIFSGWEHKSRKEKHDAMIKFHRQFSHPPTKRTITSLKDANVKDPETNDILNDASNSCDICQ